MVQVRPRYIVGYGPRENGNRPGSPISPKGVSATSSGVYTRLMGRPDAVRYSDRDSGCRSRNCWSSLASQSRSIAAAWPILSGSNISGTSALVLSQTRQQRPPTGIRSQLSCDEAFQKIVTAVVLSRSSFAQKIVHNCQEARLGYSSASLFKFTRGLEVSEVISYSNEQVRDAMLAKSHAS